MDHWSGSFENATTLARICKYAHHSRFLVVCILAFATAIVSFGSIFFELWAFRPAAGVQIYRALSLFLIFLLMFAAIAAASYRYPVTCAWMRTAAVFYSGLLLLFLVAAYDTATPVAVQETVSYAVLCLLPGVGAWRAWRAAQLLKHDRRIARLAENCRCRVKVADQTEVALKKVARKLRRPQRLRMLSTTYRGFGRIAGAVSIFLMIGPYGFQVFRYLRAAILLSYIGQLIVMPSLSEVLGRVLAEAFIPSVPVLISWLIGLPLLALATLLLIRAHRLEAFDARALRTLDSRPPILLLRSFIDDGVRLEGSRVRSNLGWMALARARGLTLEHFLSRALLPLGPLIALGEPEETLPPLGAARSYFEELTWQDAVLGMMRDACLVLVVVNDTPSLIWEIRTLAAERMLEKTILVQPPVDPTGNPARRWSGMINQLPDEKLRASLRTIDPDQALLVRFPSGSDVQAFHAVPRDIWAYDACLAMMFDFVKPLGPGQKVTSSRATYALKVGCGACLVPAGVLITGLFLSTWSFLDFARHYEAAIDQWPFYRVVIKESADIIAESFIYFETRFGTSSGEIGHSDAENIQKQLGAKRSSAITRALRITRNAQDRLLRDIVERQAAMLEAAAGPNPMACRAYLIDGVLSGLVNEGSPPTEKFLEAMETAYLDGLRRPPVPIPAESEVQPVLVNAMQGPIPLTPEEIQAIETPKTAPADGLCRAGAKWFHNISAATPPEAATAFRYLLYDGPQ
jgi:hypothetical protein